MKPTPLNLPDKASSKTTLFADQLISIGGRSKSDARLTGLAFKAPITREAMDMNRRSVFER